MKSQITLEFLLLSFCLISYFYFVVIPNFEMMYDFSNDMLRVIYAKQAVDKLEYCIYKASTLPTDQTVFTGITVPYGVKIYVDDSKISFKINEINLINLNYSINDISINCGEQVVGGSTIKYCSFKKDNDINKNFVTISSGNHIIKCTNKITYILVESN
jgi:hypothetical protein